jgi:membrane protein
MAVMLAFLKVPLSWAQILRRTFREAFFEDNCLGMAAQLAYYFFFALFPALLMVIAIASYFPYQTLVADLVTRLGEFAPREVLSIITEQLAKIASGEEGGLFTIGMLTTIWSTSAAMTAIIDTLNRAYDIEEGRPWWKVRLIAIALTVGVAVFILFSFGLVLAGPTLAERIAERFYLGDAFEWTWKILQWPVIFALVSAAFAIVYYYAPDAEQDWVWLTPGSIAATTLWLATSLGFKYYVSNLGSYTETYGAIGGVMVLMLWFYMSGLVVLLGAEMNAEIEHASPYGKDEGEKVPGEKRKIGPARMRAWMARRRRGGKVPSATEVKQVVGDPPPDAEPGAPVPPSRERSIAPTGDRGSLPPAHERQPTVVPPRAPGGGFSDYVVGAGILLTQLVMTVRSWRRRVRG